MSALSTDVAGSAPRFLQNCRNFWFEHSGSKDPLKRILPNHQPPTLSAFKVDCTQPGRAVACVAWRRAPRKSRAFPFKSLASPGQLPLKRNESDLPQPSSNRKGLASMVALLVGGRCVQQTNHRQWLERSCELSSPLLSVLSCGIGTQQESHALLF